MVDISSFDGVKSSKALNYNDFRALNNQNIAEEDISIFDSASSVDAEENAEILAAELASVKAEQGFFSNAWNEVKEFIGVGATVEGCEDAISKYKTGEISYQEALDEIEKFEQKQKNSLDLFANITTGVTSILAGTAAAAAVVASGGTATPLVIAALAGAGAGAVTKPTVKIADRATNDVKDDALDGKTIAKDAISGAITGAISGATMGNGTGAKTIAESVKISAANATKTGVITGSISGSSGYLLDCAFDEDKEFNMGELAVNTATGAVVSGTVGGILGSTNGFLKGSELLKNGGMVKVTTNEAGKKIATNTSREAIIANSVSSTEYKVANRMIRDMGESFAA